MQLEAQHDRRKQCTTVVEDGVTRLGTAALCRDMENIFHVIRSKKAKTLPFGNILSRSVKNLFPRKGRQGEKMVNSIERMWCGGLLGNFKHFPSH